MAVPAEGEHFRGALDVARILGRENRASDGPVLRPGGPAGAGTARKMAETLRASWGSQGPPYREALQAFAESAAVRFRTRTAPASLYFSERARHIVWKPVSSEWHAFAGRWDLYADVVKRTLRISPIRICPTRRSDRSRGRRTRQAVCM